MVPLNRSERLLTALALLSGALLITFIAGIWVGARYFGSSRAPSNAPALPLAEALPADTQPAVTTTEPAAPASDAAFMRLFATQRSLEAARDALRKASPGNKGGYVEKAREDVARALADLDAALNYLQAHPEVDPFKLATGPAATLPDINATTMPNLLKGGAPNLVVAQRALNAAITPLLDPATPPFGDLGGYRNKILEDINQASIDVRKGMETIGMLAPGG